MINFQAISEPLAKSPLEKPSTDTASSSPFQAIFELVEDNIDATAGTLVVTKHRIVKLLSPAAVQRFSTLEFPYSLPSEKTTIGDVKITGPDGKSRIVPSTDAKEFAPFDKIPAFANFKVVALPLNDVQPGSTLEYTTVKTEDSWIAGEYWQEIFLQEMDPIPIVKERVQLMEKRRETSQGPDFSRYFSSSRDYASRGYYRSNLGD